MTSILDITFAAATSGAPPNMLLLTALGLLGALFCAWRGCETKSRTTVAIATRQQPAKPSHQDA